MTVYVRRNRRGWIEYHIKGRYPDGAPYEERRKSHLPTITATERWAEQRERAILEDRKPKRPKAPEFNAFAEEWVRLHAEAARHKPAGIAHKRQIIKTHLARNFAGKRIDQIDQQAIAALKADLAVRELAPKTVNNILVVLSKMLRTAAKWGKIERAPDVDLLRAEKRQMPFYDAQTYDRLVAGARIVGSRALAMVLLAGDAGLRRGEILALEWSDVDFDRGIISIQRSLTHGFLGATKGNAWRPVPMTLLLRDALEQLQRNGKRVIPGSSAKRLRQWMKQAEAAARLPETGRLHILRHTYASHLAMAGESLYRLQQLLGHRDTQTTQRYSHLSPDSLASTATMIDRRRAKREMGDIQETAPVVAVSSRIIERKMAPTPGLEPNLCSNSTTPESLTKPPKPES